MKTKALRPAAIVFDENGIPSAPEFGDVYHSRGGAEAQARHVFLGGNDLPARWAGRSHFCILETGFGLGNNFLATWRAWEADLRRCERLHYVGIDAHPPSLEALTQAHATANRDHAGALIAAWPALVSAMHRLAFASGRVQLTLAFFDVRDVLPEIVGRFDAFVLDGFAPDRNPAMWQRRVLKSLGRIAASAATAATWSVARDVRDGLAEAGFVVNKAKGHGLKREMTVARYEPRFVPRRAPSRATFESARSAVPRGPVAVIGAGLAGCAAAWALAEQGLESIVFERFEAPARAASGNAAGLFHGVVSADDGPHARFGRAAALATQRQVGRWIAEGQVRGERRGLLRLEDALPSDQPSRLASMRSVIERQGLPADFIRAVDAAEARELCGWPVTQLAWFYPGGGWLDPAGLARCFVDHAGAATRLRVSTAVAALRARPAGWQLLDADGAVLHETETVVIANAGDARRLLAALWPDVGETLKLVRGQLSALPLDQLAAAAPRIPIAGSGYALPEIDGRMWFGSTRTLVDREDAAALPTANDHARNLAQLERLGMPMSVTTEALYGRVGYRLETVDRLPLIGAVPDVAAAMQGAARLDQPRFVPRLAGLYVFTALGSRGITWATLGAQALAALIAGTPCPIEASLLDAVDAARFVSRRSRRMLGRERQSLKTEAS